MTSINIHKMHIKFALHRQRTELSLRLGGGGGGGGGHNISLVSEADTATSLYPARLSLLNIFNPSFVTTFTSLCDHSN